MGKAIPVMLDCLEIGCREVNLAETKLDPAEIPVGILTLQSCERV